MSREGQRRTRTRSEVLKGVGVDGGEGAVVDGHFEDSSEIAGAGTLAHGSVSCKSRVRLTSARRRRWRWPGRGIDGGSSRYPSTTGAWSVRVGSRTCRTRWRTRGQCRKRRK